LMTWPFALGKNLLAHTIDNRQVTTPSYIRNYPTSAKKKNWLVLARKLNIYYKSRLM
jgi:hypothetical protein